MRSIRIVVLSLTLIMFAAVSIGMIAQARPEASGLQNKKSSGLSNPFTMSRIAARSYRSSGGRHKLMIDSSQTQAIERAMRRGAVQLEDYGSFKLFEISDQNIYAAEPQTIAASDDANLEANIRDDLNVLMLRSGEIDTADEAAPGSFAAVMKTGLPLSPESRYRIVQFVGPIKHQWVVDLKAAGLEPIAYIPNNGYLVRADSNTSSKVASLAASLRSRGENSLQWEGPFIDDYKIHPALKPMIAADPLAQVTIAIQVARPSSTTARTRKGSNHDVRSAKRLALATVVDAYDVANFTNLKLNVVAGSISQIAALPDVVNVEPWSPPQPFDERSAQILAANVSDDGKQLRGPGYLSWLAAHGFTAPFGFAIDVTDTGFNKGSIAPADVHPDFLDGAGQSRVVYARDYTSDLDPGDIPGHGTLNLSIAAGGNVSSEKAVRDSDGYGFGIGIAPFALLGSSKIFQASGRFDLTEPYTKLIAEAYRDGARVSSNSWGDGANSYTIDSQEYDVRSRDASPSQTGNQEMFICFAAGNGGPGRRVSSPSSAKNVLSVAASESLRRDGVDGCNVKDTDADNIFDISFFSSGGPLYDGRIKPDIAAPGTHIVGAASQHPDFDGSGVCGESFDQPYFPPIQTMYTWSSGTSHSTPQVAGGAALVRQYLLNHGEEPNTALIKALLLNTASYMNGSGAGGNLPQERQGWGLMNLNRAFDSASKIFVNQTTTFTDSGQDFVITGEVKDTSLPFRVTLAWSDAPGFSAFAPWVNDLDLEVTVNGQVYRGNNFAGQESQPGGVADTKNNVEGVWLPAGTVGAFAIHVRASNIAGDAVMSNADFSDQDFALVVYNGERKDTAAAGFSSVTVTGGADNVADPGETVSMKVSISDLSPVTLAAAHATLATRAAGITVTGASADFPDISSGQTAENTAPFTFTIDRAVSCGTLLQFTIEISSPAGFSRIPFIVRVGRADSQQLFSDGAESGESQWVHASGIKKKKKRFDTWSISARRFHSGGHAWFSLDPGQVTDSHLETMSIQVPGDVKNAQLVFFHSFEFEFGTWDGGVLEISTGGDFEDAGAKIVSGGYNGQIRPNTSNPLSGRSGWVEGTLGALKQVVVDLSSYSGKTVVIRFRFGSDETGGGGGWYIDDVMLRGDRVSCTQ